MFDLEPVTHVLTQLLGGVRDDQLTAPTPCAKSTLGDLIDHVDGFSMSFAAAAAKTPPEGGNRAPSADASRLGPDWRVRIPTRLSALASAWRDHGAWESMTQAGGVDLPSEVAGVIALDEVIVHGWDIAVASGQTYSCEPQLLQAAYGFVQATVAEHPDGSPGLFGPPVPVPDDAPLLERLIGLTGRDPAWQPPASSS
ncbi:MAG: hypothetical protein QOJ62_1116 [Actinomycetota bacterium]|nr:hypothetical protein [Actinomycetota bacterium]